MNHLPPELFPRSDEDKFLRHSHQDRWEMLKPVIVALYSGNYGVNGRPTTHDQIVRHMQTYYSFRAAASEYPHKFRAWGISDRRLTQTHVHEIATALARHSVAGMSTSRVKLKRGNQEEPLNQQKAKRHLQRKQTAVKPEPMPLGWLSSWNLPYAAFVSALPKTHDEPSPYGPQQATPGYLAINSPEATSPGQAPSGPSPNLELFYQKAREIRTSLFLQGRLKDLIVNMNKEDRRICVDYFHEFYMHGYLTAKNWGSPPSIVNISSPVAMTPSAWNANSPWMLFINTPSSPATQDPSRGINIANPRTQLCQWAIHVPIINYEPVEAEVDEQTPSPTTFADSLQNAIASGSFTELNRDNLPLSHETVVRSLSENPLALEIDSWKLAIMAGNHDLLWNLSDDRDGEPPDGLGSIYPFHLAASFINGGGPCCAMFAALSDCVGEPYLPERNVDDLGHTILDALMVSILRSHTSIHPEDVSFGFHSLSRFPGEEKDICGRWDIDSTEVRELFKNGYARIPTKWKHAFCHSAVQAIVHALIVIFGPRLSPDVNHLSGLFLRRCTECGIELKLGPLHTLVVTAFYLAQSGMTGETLFGPLAILVCLITMGADASHEVNVSVEEILRISDAGHCRHTLLTPVQLMDAVPNDVIQSWSQECQVGWACLHGVLGRAQRGLELDFEEEVSSDGYESEGSSIFGYEHQSGFRQSNCELAVDNVHDGWTKLKCTGPKIGLLWAAIQTELVTYRKIEEKDPWISSHFSMRALLQWLEDETDEFDTPLVRDRMMKCHSICGWFTRESPCLWATAQDVCRERFMNLDHYYRASFVYVPDIDEYWRRYS
ncbi:hypothetical protein F53441_5682 [Fusarium austroafricanum]|uniref:Clr5 domain-containing protein n=1 Tax=Fusarium austroafricanum TaxID=2364996 RepID=A0A8H4P0C0_9HYPO|nr:hypothetical protein F53441_5682 [Fusarium austroafricanum]